MFNFCKHRKNPAHSDIIEQLHCVQEVLSYLQNLFFKQDMWQNLVKQHKSSIIFVKKSFRFYISIEDGPPDEEYPDSHEFSPKRRLNTVCPGSSDPSKILNRTILSN